ncbi:MAG TPA: glycosyltransferase, partial [Terrimesophilobacter sp.]|nr:glycosyltransferase [Terrimesophilobacter sp.]
HILAYSNRMDLALAAADLVLSRAGAATVSEVSALGLPAVYVPLAIGNGEQRKNARGVVDAGGAILVEDKGFTEQWVRDELVSLLQRPVQLAAMAAATEQVGTRHGTHDMVSLIDAAVAESEHTEHDDDGSVS